jgi:hypothetical protein
VKVLSEQSLCRTVTYRHLELGLNAVGPVISKATAAGLEQAASSRDDEPRQVLAFGLRYLINLQLTHISTASDEELVAPVIKSWSESGSEYRGLFFGWFVAALSRRDRIGAPEQPDARLETRERAYLKAAASVAGGQLEYAARQLDWLIPPAIPRAKQGELP